jgi:hypothetical protein
MIAKAFLLAKTFRAYGTNFLRQEKSFQDHSAKHGRSVNRAAGAADGTGEATPG